MPAAGRPDSVGTDHQFTDIYFTNATGDRTMVVDGTGEITEQSVEGPPKYICAYPLVR